MSENDACWTYSRPVPGLLPWQSYFIAFVIGIFAVQYPAPAIATLIVFIAADRSLRDRSCRLPGLVFLCCAAFGFGYASQRTPLPPEQIPAWMEQRLPARAEGIVERAEPRAGDRLRVIVGDVSCRVEGSVHSLPGKIAWTIRHPQYMPEPGQRVSVQLRILPVRGFGNPGGWDYGWYWQRQGVFWRAWMNGKEPPRWGDPPGGWLWSVKAGLRTTVRILVPDTQGGAMVLALVTGDRSQLDAKTMDATRAAGLAHTLALSGLHVGFVAALGLGLAWFAGLVYPPLLLSIPRQKLAVLLAAPMVLAYAWLGQPSTSLVRAATMFGFWGVLLLQGRGRVLMDGLFFALAAIVLWSPLSVFDLSLQMSAMAVAGIGLMYPRIRVLFGYGHVWWSRALGWAAGLLAISVCANVALLPLVSWYFGTLSPNFLLNLLWLPVLGFLVMPVGILGMLLGSISWAAGAGAMLLGMASAIMDWLLAILHGGQAAGLTPVFAVLRPLWPEILGFGLLLVVAVIVWSGAKRVPVGMACVGFALLVAPHVSIMASDAVDRTRLTVLDVGLGQSLVLSLPGGHRWLLDGGGGSSNFDIGEAVVAPALTHGRPPRLDGVFMTHPDADHSHGLPFILSRFDVGEFYTNGMMPRGRTGRRMRALVEGKAVDPVVLGAGERVDLGSGAVLEILHPNPGFTNSRANEHSLVMRLVRKGRPLALLPGDVEKGGIEAVLAGGGEVLAEVLVLPHHGSRTSHVPEFYRAVAADVALCSNGYLNRYGFPSPEVVGDVNVPVFSTSRHGQIAAVWGGDGELSVMASQP